MKTLLILFLFSISVITTSAQEKKFDNNDNITTSQALTKKADTQNLIAKTNKEKKDEKRICYAEKSKVTFYKALIEKNGFDIEINDTDNTSSKLVLRNTEQIITRNKQQIAYVD